MTAPSPRDAHPALVGAAWRRGRVTGHEVTATLVHLIGRDALTVRAVDVVGRRFGNPHTIRSVELRLVPGVTTATRRDHAPFVAQGRIEGLTRLDRQLLSILFDRIADAPVISLPELQRFASAKPWEYWCYVREWRRAAQDDAREHAPTRQQALELRRDTLAALESGRLTNSLPLISVFGFEKRMLRHLAASGVAGSVAALYAANEGDKAPIVAVSRVLSPGYPFAYSPPARVGYTPVPSRARGLIVRADEE